MSRMKRVGLLLAAALLMVSLSACTIPTPGFADYDVSSYIQALLDSSYHQDNEDFMAITGTTEDKAEQNNVDTVENAAVLFCNAYGIYPTDAQLVELQKVMRQAYQLSKYTVKEEQKTDTGYYLEVEVTPITNFKGRAADLEKLKEEAQEEATAANQSSMPESSLSEDSYTEDGYYDDSYDSYEEEDSYGEDGTEEETSSETSSQVSSSDKESVDANALYVDKVVEFCQNELKNLTYDSPVTISLEILQTDEGELQLDMNQISVLDETVVYLSK